MGLRLVSLKPLFQRLERAARDLSRDLNKPLDVHFEGETVEVDKTVLEKLTDPLIHILRNAVDHGLESSQDREATGKPLRGTLLFKAVQNAGRLVFEISDDGKGLDSELLKKIAIEKGLIDPQTQLSVSESYQLMFRAGFSTKEKVTEISGRGIGLDVVKHNIERLNGEIQVRSEVGKGTTFVIRLPQSLAIIEGMVVWAGGERFVVPAAYIDETVASKELDLRSVDGAHSQHIQLRNELIPVYDLPSLLGLTPSVESPEAIVLVCRQLSVPFALRVDDVVGQQSVVTKRLGVELSKIKGVSGSAILGDGRPCLILELPDLMSDSLAAEAENRSHENKAPSPGRTV
jgi:two-component system chemotaxis sensor kinase CheA